MAKYKSKIMETVHRGVKDLYESGHVTMETMRDFDERCLTPVESMSPEDIRALRQREMVSQSVLASYLYVSVNTVSQWERGERKPVGPSLKLLSLVKAKGLQAIR